MWKQFYSLLSDDFFRLGSCAIFQRLFRDGRQEPQPCSEIRSPEDNDEVFQQIRDEEATNII